MDAWQDDEGNFHFKPRRVEFLSYEAYLQAVRAWHQAQEAALAREFDRAVRAALYAPVLTAAAPAYENGGGGC